MAKLNRLIMACGLGGLLFSAPPVEAKVLLQDGAEGAAVHALQKGETVTGTCTLSDDASPFASSAFGTSKTSYLLTDNDPASSPALSGYDLDAAPDDTVNIRFDFKYTAPGAFLWEFCAGNSVYQPYAFHMTSFGPAFRVYGRKNAAEKPDFLPIPGITQSVGDWYHVEVLLRPASSPAEKRTYDITLTQDHNGARTTGTLAGVLNEDPGPIKWFRVANIRFGNAPAGPDCRLNVDNVLIETASAGGTKGNTDFRYAYLPSHHKIRYYVGARPSNMSDWQVELLRSGDNRQIARDAGKFPLQVAGGMLDIPALTDKTEYKVRLTLTGAGVTDTVERTFTHHDFPWSNSPAGMDDTVIVPPFTPLVTDAAAKTVDCVLRRHTMNTAGLWNQVRSKDTDLLTAPVSLKIISGGKIYTAAGTSLNFITVKPHRVTGHTGDWTAGPVSGSTSFDYDYDGLMKVTLNFNAAESVVVDTMYLEIPFKNSEAWLMNPVTDYAVTPRGMRVPSGSGSVWNSANVYRNQMPAPFVPYIWVGGPERGICWLAENDKDWALDPVKPAMELIREDEALYLRIKFITKPIILNRTRTINFALMATPAKPLPETPNFRKWWSNINDSTLPLSYNVLCNGDAWGDQTGCALFYPAFHNYSIFEELKKDRATGRRSPDFIDAWTAQFSDSVYTETWKTGLRANIESARNITTCFPSPANPAYNQARPRYVFSYTNPRGMAWDDEMQTYLDEWSIYDIADPRWEAATTTTDRPATDPTPTRLLRENAAGYNITTLPAGVAYQADPMPSYVNHALYYHNKMYDTYSDGIYWDCFFLQANYCPFPGPGYVGDDNRLHPGVNIYAFRDLAKRNMIMQHQRGMKPLEWIHMSGINIIPMLSFGTISFDFEFDVDPAKDMQDRFNLDNDTAMVLAQSTGFQAGNIGLMHPIYLNTEWLRRTAWAVCLPHEMKLWSWSETSFTIAHKLTAFGYGESDCAVYRYWDTNPAPPVAISGAAVNVKPLVMKRPNGQANKAYIIFSSFGEGGDIDFTLNTAALGLPAVYKVYEDETGAELAPVGTHQYRFAIKKHDFRLIRIE